MDVDSIQETGHTPYYGPWSPWSPWTTICRLGMVTWQTRERTREVGETWSRRTHHEECEPFEIAALYQTWLQVVSDGPWETVSQTSTATQREYRSVTLVTDVVVAAWNVWRVAVLPTIHRGDRLHLDWRGLSQLREVKSFRAEFDGQPLDRDEYILGDDLEEGHHAIDLHVETVDGPQDYQVGFATAARFVTWFPEPVAELRLPKPGRPNGTKLSVMVANRSLEAVQVRPTVVGVPAGWKAVFLDPSSSRLGAGRQREFTLQVEAMTDAAIRRDPQPLAIAVKAVGPDEGSDETACASAVLRVTGDDASIERIEKLSARRMKRHRPLLSVPFDERRSKQGRTARR